MSNYLRNLRKNQISRLKGLQNLQRLRYLYLSSNALEIALLNEPIHSLFEESKNIFKDTIAMETDEIKFLFEDTEDFNEIT